MTFTSPQKIKLESVEEKERKIIQPYRPSIPELASQENQLPEPILPGWANNEEWKASDTIIIPAWNV